MNSDQSEPHSTPSHRKNPEELLEEYISSCKKQTDIGADTNERNSTKIKHSRKEGLQAFPNLAGFCRYLGMGIEELQRLAEDEPQAYDRILTVLEDEALNSGLPPALLSTYLKRRMGYEGAKTAPTEKLSIDFEHDIYEAGE